MPNGLLPHPAFDTLSAALAVLTAMITPALLISATGTFILSTSTRLGRVVDRVRAIGDRLDSLMHDTTGLELVEERKAMLLDQMRQLSRRATILQRTLTVFYVAAALFVLTSVAIGIDALFNQPLLHWLPVALGIAGSFGLMHGSIILILEARLAVAALHQETAFLQRLAEADVHLVGGLPPKGPN